ncbi:hypothetical protein F2Q68_00017891 [Brassica cretica]|uniref:Uncharacterized protein n=1 Tax=Brassica cretica TaxID=69181 RepID=A0A8S9HNS7_BRACR|nr:hypothetical protein F2Q68_00017891 [Brassica cretica]
MLCLSPSIEHDRSGLIQASSNSLILFDDLKAVGRVPVEILMKYSPPFEIGQHLRSLLVG